MPSSSEFFEQRSPQAVLKHGVLTRYAYYFAGRAGRATHGRVAFIDGYAGEGRYQDGNPGSPLLLASEASRAAGCLDETSSSPSSSRTTPDEGC